MYNVKIFKKQYYSFSCHKRVFTDISNYLITLSPLPNNWLLSTIAVQNYTLFLIFRLFSL